MTERLSAESFLENWQAGSITNGLVGIEHDLLLERLAQADQEFEQIVRQKKDVQSGDDWHDGAFRATDAAANNLAQQVQMLHEAERWPLVELPAADFGRITLGSRALIGFGSAPFPIEIVGMRILHQNREIYEEQGIDVVSPDSELGKRTMGRQPGEEFDAELGGRKRHITILSVETSPDLAEN